jgi:hypothetical protein
MLYAYSEASDLPFGDELLAAGMGSYSVTLRVVPAVPGAAAVNAAVD